MKVDISNTGIKDTKEIYYNLDFESLVEHELKNGECKLANNGATMVDTGIFTGRSPADKYFVNKEPSNRYISWGNINQPVEKEVFEELLELSKKQLSDKELYVTDVYCGSSESSKRSIRFITELAWQSHFVTNMFIRPSMEQLQGFKPEFTVLNACKTVNAKWKEHGLNSEVFVLFDVEENIAVIGGSYYGGEMKKGIFSMMNYWLPLEGKLSMHCSANIGYDGDTCLFFGLSGTGKTTLSTDPHRRLIGDD